MSRPMVWRLPVHRDRFCFGPFRLRFRGVSPQPFRLRQWFRQLPQQFWRVDDPLPKSTQQLHRFLCSLFVARL